MSEPTHAALLLAAGASRRLGVSKQLLSIDGVPLIRRAAEVALATRPRLLRVALGAEVDGCRAALTGLPIEVHVAADWVDGMGASLASAVRALPDEFDGLLVFGVDQPALDAAHLNALVERWRADPTQVVASGYAGVAGTPALFPASWRSRLATLSGDEGARQLLRDGVNPPRIVHAPQLAHDIDDAQDFAAWRDARSSPGEPR